MIKLGIIDDKPDVRKGLMQVFGLFDEIEVVLEGKNGEMGVDLVKMGKNLPHLILMDVEMPGIGGIEATKQIKAVKPDIKILMLSVANDENYLKQALVAGADGYLLKGEQPLKIIQLIKDTLDGRVSMSPEMADKTLEILRNSNQEKLSPTAFKISPRELEVLKALCSGKSYQVAAKDLFISPQTVRSHTENIYRKLNVHSKVEASKIAFDNGWF